MTQPLRTPPRRLFLQRSALGMAALPLLPLARWAQASEPTAWPTRPVTILVGFPGGSSPDLTARVLAEQLSHVLPDQPFVVENRPGAGGNIAAATLVRSRGDHTISVMINGNLTIAHLLNAKVGFDPMTDFAPIALVGAAPYVLTVHAPLADGLSPQAFLEKARAAGDTWNYGSPGIGTVAHLGMELVNSRTGMRATHVPYQGNPQALQAVVTGEIQMSLLPPAMALSQQKAGNVALIGITSAERSPLTSDLPSLQELGVEGLDLEVWNAVAVPASMPADIQARLREAITQALAAPEARAKLLEQGWVVGDTSAQALRARIASDAEALGTIIREQNIRIDG